MSARHRGALLWMAVILMAAVVAMSPLRSQAEEFLQLPDGSKVDISQKCPVCGMQVGGKDQQGVAVNFKDGRVVGFHGVAAAVFKDGHVVGFDGARCLFVYNSVPQKYNIDVSDIARQYVTDFATKKMIELPTAFLVLGSEVKGLMGYELIPFGDKAEAGKFATEYDGKWIVQLHEVARAAKKDAEGGVQPGAGGASTLGENTTPAPEASPEATPSKDRSVERTRKRPAQQRIQEPEPFVGAPGHHGGGHHGR
ncbi:MAG: nitrous oxide reductase accessory protein NosL [Desulfomonile tiedjei]|nr:nitrous oxide reductase accessory protein NosL [Desulfomonile tiedjei]